ncbi:hypothetical protein B0H17DRAFT_1211842 [Mycena rosella]|uniref:Uncharacterized protein n=1 Tax=Mycena rosella TaxID=1033263 RepID=A0AAD7CTN5_MYCRO|nr:hypothetical protein B0H17DRAFT_1211842 [Mycena rosella]
MAAAGLWTTPSNILQDLRVVFDCLSSTRAQMNGFEQRNGLILVGDIPLAGCKPPVSDPKLPVGIAWMSNSNHGAQLGGRIVTVFGWLVDEPLKINNSVVDQLFFPVLPATPAEHDKVAKQIEGWRVWVGQWQMKDGGDVALYSPRVAPTIGESGGLPTLSISVLVDTTTLLVLLPAAFHHTDVSVHGLCCSDEGRKLR